VHVCICLYVCTVWVKKIPPGVFWHFFQTVGNFYSKFYKPSKFYIPIYVRLQIFIQLSPTVTKLCHIKCDHPACVSAICGHFEHMIWTGWSCSIWHNFVKVAGRWIKICSLAWIGTCNRHVKFGLKFPTIWENARKPQGGFFDVHFLFCMCSMCFCVCQRISIVMQWTVWTQNVTDGNGGWPSMLRSGVTDSQQLYFIPAR